MGVPNNRANIPTPYAFERFRIVGELTDRIRWANGVNELMLDSKNDLNRHVVGAISGARDHLYEAVKLGRGVDSWPGGVR